MKSISVNRKLQATYDNYYNGKSQWRRLSAIDKANNIITLCSAYPHKTILEVGSGEGSILKRLSDLQFGEALYSLEISKSAVETISKINIKSLVECKIFDGYNIPYEDKKFDLVILSHVIEHLEYPRKMIYEACRVARFLFVEVPLEYNIKLKKDFVLTNMGHINFYSPKTIRGLLQTCNLEVLHQVVTNPSYKVYRYMNNTIISIMKYTFKELMLKIMPGVATFLWTYHSSLICRERKT